MGKWAVNVSLLETYEPGAFYDELMLPSGKPRPHSRALAELLDSMTPAEFAQRARLRAELNYPRADEIIVGGLHEYLQSVQKRCTEIGGSITRTYLSYQ